MMDTEKFSRSIYSNESDSAQYTSFVVNGNLYKLVYCQREQSAILFLMYYTSQNQLSCDKSTVVRLKVQFPVLYLLNMISVGYLILKDPEAF